MLHYNHFSRISAWITVYTNKILGPNERIRIVVDNTQWHFQLTDKKSRLNDPTTRLKYNNDYRNIM
jgi:hypothetical protein